MDKDVLEEDYIPESIPCREAQKKELVFCISPVEKGRKPFDCLFHGKPGTGKTALVKYILQQLNENTNALGFYVNCWESKTLNLILDGLIEQAHVVVSDVSSSAKISRLKQKLKGKACVVVLDEIDKLDTRGLNNILYILKEIGKIGIVCISNTRKYVLNLDPRVTSRLSFNSINFPH